MIAAKKIRYAGGFYIDENKFILNRETNCFCLFNAILKLPIHFYTIIFHYFSNKSMNFIWLRISDI